MKLLENYVVTDRRGYDIAAKRCNQWLDEGVADVAEATIELLKGAPWSASSFVVGSSCWQT